MAKKATAKAAEFWESLLKSPPDSGSIAHRDALKKLRTLPDDLDPVLYRRVVRHFLEASAYAFWPEVGHTPVPLVATLVEILAERDEYEARALLKVQEIGGADALRELAALMAWFEKSTNLPGLLKRMPSHPPVSATVSAAIVAIVTETTERTDKLWPFWALAWLAMRADESLAKTLEARSAEWNNPILGGTDADVFRRVHASALGAAKRVVREKKSPPALDVPKKVSEAKKWLAAHSPANAETLRLLAHREKQKASEAAAAIRTLALLGTNEALDVLASYRPDVGKDGADHQGGFGETFTGPVAAEMIRAWPRFGREFATRMFSGLVRLWLLQSGTQVDDLSGIETAEGLRDLRILLGAGCDLEPLTACRDLVRLHLNLALRTDDGRFEALGRIPGLTHLEVFNAMRLDDGWVASVCNGKKIERLYIDVAASVDLDFLLHLPALRRLKLAGGDDRSVDEKSVATLRELVSRGTDVSLYRHEPWALAIAKHLPELTFVDDAGVVLTADSSRKDALALAVRMNSFLEAAAGPDLARHLRTQTALSLPAIAGGEQ